MSGKKAVVSRSKSTSSVVQTKIYAVSLIETHFDPKRLKPTGRLQFSFYSPSSDLPVRDVCNEQGHDYKTEPHLERNAENYVNKCYQKNIQGLLKHREKYLFLFTTCKSKSSVAGNVAVLKLEALTTEVQQDSVSDFRNRS